MNPPLVRMICKTVGIICVLDPLDSWNYQNKLGISCTKLFSKVIIRIHLFKSLLQTAHCPLPQLTSFWRVRILYKTPVQNTLIILKENFYPWFPFSFSMLCSWHCFRRCIDLWRVIKPAVEFMLYFTAQKKHYMYPPANHHASHL